jgi:peptidoglycan/LPS O-acetylase OafA/YrhL
MELPLTTPSYRPDIDGLRAAAILSVVFYHAGLPGFSGGFTGVDIFFVISGYLIGGHIFAELVSGTFSFLRFYQRRAKRILPAFYVVLAFSTLVALVLLSPLEATSFAKMAIASILSASNLHLLRSTSYFQSANELNPLLMTWSLGVEEQFYAVIPFLLVLVNRVRSGFLLPTVVALSALSFALAWGELGHHPNSVFYALPYRAWELGAGVTLAAIESASKPRKAMSAGWCLVLSLAGLALMLEPIFLLTPKTPFPGPAAVPSVLGTAALIASRASWLNRKILSVSGFVYLGRVSYSWYLWHWPLLAFLRIVSGRDLPREAITVTIAISLAAAMLSYHFVEQPFRGASGAPVSLLLRYAGASLCFLAILAGLWISHGLPARYQADIPEEARTPDPCLSNYGTDKPNLSFPCYNSTDTRPAVVLWGDSHASALAPVLAEIANAQGYNFIELTRSACLPTLDQRALTATPLDPQNIEECVRFNRRTLDLIQSDQRARIVILAGRWANNFFQDSGWGKDGGSDVSRVNAKRNELTTSLGLVVEGIQGEGKRVILIDDVPNFNFDPALVFLNSRMPLRHSLAAWLGFEEEPLGFAPDGHFTEDKISSSILTQIRQMSADIEVVDPKVMLCNGNLCAYMIDNQLLYSDNQHLTAAGARYALSKFHLPRL